MDIVLENLEIVKGVKKIEQRSDITDRCRLFYELGEYQTYSSYGWSGWELSGKFKEISNPVGFRDQDDRLDNHEYIKHHNFVIKENEPIR